MSKTPLPPGEKKVLWNGKLPPATVSRLKTIATRRSIMAGKNVSEAVIVQEKIDSMPMPPPPTPEEVAIYEARHDGGVTVWNGFLPPASIERLKEIAFRLSVARGKKVSEATIVEEEIENTRLPKTPTPEQIAAYEARHEKV